MSTQDFFTVTEARVDLAIFNNATWRDAFQFGDPTDTSWNFTGQNFVMEVKASKEDRDTFLLQMSTGNGRIVVDDEAQRILHFNVPDSVIRGNLTPGDYHYDLIMVDGSKPPVRVMLMRGKLRVKQGITDDDEV